MMSERRERFAVAEEEGIDGYVRDPQQDGGSPVVHARLNDLRFECAGNTSTFESIGRRETSAFETTRPQIDCR